jgi:hypothetical protein
LKERNKSCPDPEEDQAEAAVAADLEVAEATEEALAADLAAAVADSAEVLIITITAPTIITTDLVFTVDSGDPDVIITEAEVALAACSACS